MIKEDIYTILKKQCIKKQNDNFLSFPDENKHYNGKNLLKNVDIICNALSMLGISQGDCIGVLLSNRSQWALLALAAGSMGVTMIPINTGVSKDTLNYFMSKVKIKAIFYSVNYKNNLHGKIINKYCSNNKFVQVLLDGGNTSFKYNKILWKDFIILGSSVHLKLKKKVSSRANWLIQFTSGTTGLPKGVMISQYSAINVANEYGKNSCITNKDIILQTVPYFHCIGSVMNLLTCIIFGVYTIVMNKFNSEEANLLISKYHCTITSGVPTIYYSMMCAKNFNRIDNSSLRLIYIGGARCSPSLFDKISNNYSHATVMCGYGLTETASIVISPNINDDYIMRREGIGHPFKGIELKINDFGELLIKGFSNTRGYINDLNKTKDLFDSFGWLHTGDIAELSDNNVRVIGRLDDIIEKGGEKISPSKIEEAIGNYVIDKKICVAGIRDDKYGEDIIAFIECSSKYKNYILNNRLDLIKTLKKHIMNFEIPKYISFLKSFPMTKNGKIKRNELIRMYLGKKIHPYYLKK